MAKNNNESKNKKKSVKQRVKDYLKLIKNKPTK